MRAWVDFRGCGDPFSARSAGARRRGALPTAQRSRKHQGQGHAWGKKLLHLFCLLSAGSKGFFDWVRLAPHFAPDDNFRGTRELFGVSFLGDTFGGHEYPPHVAFQVRYCRS